MKRLAGKVAIITGGAAGIGKTAVETFVKAGATVLIWDVNESAGQATAAAINTAATPVVFQKVNTADAQNVSDATEAAVAQFGKIDILINNAGITRDATLLKMSQEQWQSVIDINLTGVFNCTQSIAKQMVAAGSGRIINTSSVVALYGNFGQTNYVAAKSALIGMTKVWAKELGRKGITVNAVAPGFIETDMIKTVPQKVIDGITGKTPLARLGQPEDIANAYLFLASDEASFINGHCLSVDGGITL